MGCLRSWRYSMSWPVSSSSTGKAMKLFPVVCAQCGEQLVDQAVVGLAEALGGWFARACGVLPDVMGWIGSRWILLVGGRVVQLVYPPLEVGQEYALGTVEEPWREVAG